MHSSIQVNSCLIFHDWTNQWAPNKSVSLCSGKHTQSAYRPGTQGLICPGESAFWIHPCYLLASTCCKPSSLCVTSASSPWKADDLSSSIWVFLPVCSLCSECFKYLAFGLAKHSADAGSLNLRSWQQTRSDCWKPRCHLKTDCFS